MIAMVAGYLAKSALMQSPLGATLKGIPRGVWLALAAGVLVLFVVRWHSHKIATFGKERFDAGYAQAVADGKKANKRVDQGSTAIATRIRSNVDAKLRDNTRHADALHLRGPGAAACVNPSLPAATGGHVSPAGGAGPAVAGVPDEARIDLIALPYDEAVDRAETNDANRVEDAAWRQWHTELTAWWLKISEAPQKPR